MPYDDNTAVVALIGGSSEAGPGLFGLLAEECVLTPSALPRTPTPTPHLYLYLYLYPCLYSYPYPTPLPLTPTPKPYPYP